MKYITVADYIVSFLESVNSKKIFLLPGGGNMYLVDAVKKNKKIQAVPMHHEQSTGIAAEAYSRISGKVGVSIVTTGPGATNVITGVAAAWIESTPMIIISGQVKTSDMLGAKKLRQNGVQEVNIIPMIKGITKYSKTIKNEKDTYEILKKAYVEAISGRPGPVWIDVPLNIQAKKIKKKIKKEKIFLENYTKDFNIIDLKKLLSKSKRPVILFGHGVRISKAEQLVKKIAKKFSIPLLFTWNAMDLLEFNNKFNFGKPGGVALRYPNFIIQNSDLLISIGASLDNITTAYNPNEFAKNAKKIMVNIDKNVLKNTKVKCIKKICCDSKIFLKKFLDFRNYNNDWDEWIKYCKRVKEKYKLENEKKFNFKGKIKHFELVKNLSKYLPKNSLIATGSSGLSIEQFYTFFENRSKQRIFLTSGLGSMGFGLPAAIGAYFASKKKLFLIEGDGSFQLNLQELAVISEFKIPICIIIFNNNGYASIRNTQKNYFNNRFCGTGPEANLSFPNLKNISKAYKISYLKIDDRKNLYKLKNIFVRNSKPIIIDVSLLENEILSPKVSSIITKDGKIKSLPLEDMSPLLPIKELKKIMQGKISKVSMLIRKNG